MRNRNLQWFAPVASGLLMLGVSHVASACPPTPSDNPAPPTAPAAGVSGTLSPQQSAALARQHLRRCQLHPGACEQSKGPEAHAAHEGKNGVDAPDLKEVPRD